jgi:superfamily II DNA or RNA helicase
MHPMTLAEALAQDVHERTRTKGNRYFLGGAVRAIEGSDSHVSATVRGSQWYSVNLRRDGDAIVASCECPYFADRDEVCKHVWAVVLAADASGFLIGNSPFSADTYLEIDHVSARADRRAPAASQPTTAAEPWRRFLSGVQERIVRESPAAVSRHAQGEILYVIDERTSERSGQPNVQVLWRVRKKSGEWGKPQPAAILPTEVDQLPDEADRSILPLLLGASDSIAVLGGYSSVYSRTSFDLYGELADRVLPLLARSGRFHLRRVAADAKPNDRAVRRPSDLEPLAWDDGPAWVFRLDVASQDDGPVRVDGRFARGEQEMSVRGPDVVFGRGYLIANAMVARMDHAGAFAWLTELRRSGPALVPAEAAADLMETLAQSNVEPAHLPDDLRYDVVDGEPRPRIRIARSAKPQGHGTREELDAVVQFDYGGSVMSGRRGRGSYDREHRRMIRRRPAAESAALQRLQALGFHKPWYFEAQEDTLAIAVERFPDAVRKLVEEGWHVEAEGRVFRAARSLDVQVKSGIDWFELHGRVDFGDGRATSIAELLAALRRREATVLLDDGSRGLVPEEWLRRYARVAAFGEASGDHVRYRSTQTALLDALLESQPSVSVDDAFARARAELAEFSGVRPQDPPATFHGRLRDYQRDALGWFAFLRQFGFGGCLADDMGLGKTVMVLALLESRRLHRDPGTPRASVAIVPRSLVFNWTDEAARFAPELRILDYTGDARTSAEVDQYDLLLTTYGTLRRDAALLTEHEFDYVILDEAQAIKNAATASAKAARLLRGRHRLALSGTPIENHLGELWSLFEFLNPGFLGPAAAFGRAVAPARGERADRIDLAVIGRALRPFILRRTKEQVAPELPAKFEQTIHCDLEPAERRFYDELRAHYRRSLLKTVASKGMNRSKLQVLEALLRLRQAASHVGLIDERRRGEQSTKFEMLLSRLREIAEEGHKALVFSQFTSLLGLLRPHLDRDGIVHEYLDGETRDRAGRVQRFDQDAGCPVFLISLKAGGLGLNLTAADYVFLLDPWWNPAVEAQAIDRAHRIGQSRHVFAYRLIARDTVEEKIAELQQTKRELADSIFSADAGLMKALQPEDLEWLLS